GPVTANGIALGPDGILIAPSSTLTDTGDWSNGGGIFDANGGTFVLAGINQHPSGATIFNKLTKIPTPADTLTFQARSTQTVTGLLTLQGTALTPLALRSSVPGTPWQIEPEGSVAVANLDIQDGTNVAAAPLGASGSRNSGGNTGWIFQAA